MKLTNIILVVALVALCLFQVSSASWLKSLGHDLDDAGHDVANAADDAGHDVANAADDVGHAVEKGADDVGNAADDAGHAVEKGADTVVKDAESPEGQKIIKTAGTVIQVAGAVSDTASIIKAV